MSNELLSSKVVIREVPPAQRGIPSLPTSVAGAVGIAEKGPIGAATLVSSWEEYTRIFGAFAKGADLPLGVLGFFKNGGRQLWVVRTCHYTDVTDPTTATAVVAGAALLSTAIPTPAQVLGAAVPIALASGDAIKLVANGKPLITVPFSGTPASLASTSTAPFALAVGQTLQFAIDGGATQTFTVAAAKFADVTKATAAELAAALGQALVGVDVSTDAQGHVVVASATRGNASRVEAKGGTASANVVFPAPAALGTGNVARLSSVSLPEIAATLSGATPDVRADTAPNGALRLSTVATGAGATLQIQAGTAAAFGFDSAQHAGGTSPATRIVQLDAQSAGAWANQISVEARAGSQPALTSLFVREGAALVESFPDVSMDATSPRYLVKLVNDPSRGSSYLRATDLKVAGATLAAQTAQLQGGDDGLNNLGEDDLLGSADGGTGVHALDNVPDLSIVFVPGAASASLQNALLSYASDIRRGSVFVVLDAPIGLSAAGMLSYLAQAGLEGVSEYGALYWPRLVIANPDPSIYGVDASIVAPPSGSIAGVFARVDGARAGGVYDPPAGTEVGQINGASGLETTEVLDENKRDLLYPHRINPLNRTATGVWYVDGVYTLKGDGNFPTVAERRGVSYIERSLRNGLEFARHRNNDDALASEVQRTIKSFLVTQMDQGAFASRDPKTAFFIDVSRDPGERLRGELHVKVGLATQKPAEFIVVEIMQAALPSA